MGKPSELASNALIYPTYGAFLTLGCYLAWRWRHQAKKEFISSNNTQTAIPLASNFVSSALGSAVLFSYPQLGTIAGVQGVVVYAATSAIPLMTFIYFGRKIRKKLPNGFILTEWVRQRYGLTTGLFLSFLSLGTQFLYMVAELSACQSVVSALTGLDGLPVIIVEVIVTTIYTSLGGFKVSFATDNIQGFMICALIAICAIAIGVTVHIDTELIRTTHMLNTTLLGWQLIWIFSIGICCSNMFLSSFWMRAFASKTNRDLFLGVSLASITVFVVLLLVGFTGVIAVWSGVKNPGSIAFFLLIETLPAWVVGIALVMVVSLSTAVFDSLQSAMVSTLSNDLFRNRLPLIIIRFLVVLICIPVIVIAITSPSILALYLITNIFACAAMPAIFLGLYNKFYFLQGLDVIVGTLGGIFSVFVFGTIYYGDAKKGAGLLLIEEGLYVNDWSVFGAFTAAPLGSLAFTAAGLLVRVGVEWVWCRLSGRNFDAFDKPNEFGQPAIGVDPDSESQHPMVDECVGEDGISETDRIRV